MWRLVGPPSFQSGTSDLHKVWTTTGGSTQGELSARAFGLDRFTRNERARKVRVTYLQRTRCRRTRFGAHSWLDPVDPS